MWWLPRYVRQCLPLHLPIVIIICVIVVIATLPTTLPRPALCTAVGRGDGQCRSEAQVGGSPHRAEQ